MFVVSTLDQLRVSLTMPFLSHLLIHGIVTYLHLLLNERFKLLHSGTAYQSRVYFWQHLHLQVFVYMTV